MYPVWRSENNRLSSFHVFSRAVIKWLFDISFCTKKTPRTLTENMILTFYLEYDLMCRYSTSPRLFYQWMHDIIYSWIINITLFAWINIFLLDGLQKWDWSFPGDNFQGKQGTSCRKWRHTDMMALGQCLRRSSCLEWVYDVCDVCECFCWSESVFPLPKQCHVRIFQNGQNLRSNLFSLHRESKF